MDRAVSSYQKVFGFALTNEPLTRVDRDFNLLPAAATHWEVSEDGSRGSSICSRTWFSATAGPSRPTTTKIPSTAGPIRRPGSISNGTTVHQALGEVVPPHAPGFLGVEALDRHTIAFTTTQPTPYAPELLNYSWVTPTHLFEKYGPPGRPGPRRIWAAGPSGSRNGRSTTASSSSRGPRTGVPTSPSWNASRRNSSRRRPTALPRRLRGRRSRLRLAEQPGRNQPRQIQPRIEGPPEHLCGFPDLLSADGYLQPALQRPAGAPGLQPCRRPGFAHEFGPAGHRAPGFRHVASGVSRGQLRSAGVHSGLRP